MDAIHALRVQQWLSHWDSFHFDEGTHQSKPEDAFYATSIPAGLLRRLAYVSRRGTKGSRLLDLGIQRGHDEERSRGISLFIDGGYPWASLPKAQRAQRLESRKPGWLPTSVVANIVGTSQNPSDSAPDEKDLIRIEQVDGSLYRLILPDGCDNPEWRPKRGHPIQIIDGQHRLLAFDEDDPRGDDFQLPVVVFNDLDISWQAYLFWTINITPKRISPSFAFDLYPLLRTQDWLEVEGPQAYRETRSQELTEVLWSHPESPWRDRIGMLGRERGKVTQAAWVRSLTVSMVRPWDSPGATGGLFGSQLTANDQTHVLMWSRPQQAAYLVQLWKEVADAVESTDELWAQDLRRQSASEGNPAFMSLYSILATEQGVRGVLQITNDLLFGLAGELDLQDWRLERLKDPIELQEVTDALKSLRSQSKIMNFTRRLAKQVARFDWRSQATPGLNPDVRNQQALFRAGTGYREVRRHLLKALSACEDRQLANQARQLVAALGY